MGGPCQPAAEGTQHVQRLAWSVVGRTWHAGRTTRVYISSSIAWAGHWFSWVTGRLLHERCITPPTGYGRRGRAKGA